MYGQQCAAELSPANDSVRSNLGYDLHRYNNPIFTISRFAVFTLLLFAFVGCGKSKSSSDSQQVVVYTSIDRIFSEPVLKVICRELKRASPGIRIDIEDVEEIISHEVAKRDVMSSPEVQAAVKRIKKARQRKLRDRKQVAPKTPALTGTEAT